MLVGDVVRQRRPLWVTRRACGRRVRVDPGQAADRVGYDTPIPSADPVAAAEDALHALWRTQRGGDNRSASRWRRTMTRLHSTLHVRGLLH